MNVRLDKWLQVARVFKTRTQATRACNLGRVRVNGSAAKPHRTVELEDEIEVKIDDWTRRVVVKGIHDKPLPKEKARELLLDLSQPRPKRDYIDRILFEGSEARDKGMGRPTKRARRDIDRLKGR